MSTRRGVLVGLGCLLAAPAIVRASSLMPIKPEPKVALTTLADYADSDFIAIYSREYLQRKVILRAFYGGHMPLPEPSHPTAIEIRERIRCHLQSAS